MNCQEAQERLVELFDLDAPRAVDLEQHLAACPRCAADYAALESAVRAVDSRARIHASPDFKERVMRKLTEVEPAPRRWRFMPRLALVGVAAIIALVLFMPRTQSPALSLMAQSAEAMSNLQSVHITARMRTLPNDNFEFIDPKLDWVPLEIWKQFGDTPRWRVEKPGRVAVMDGTSSVMLMGSESAVRGGRFPGFLDWLNGLLDTAQIMDRELEAARSGHATARLAQQDQHLTLAVHRAMPGDPRNDWLLSMSVSTSNHTRVYRFDAATKRLESMQIVLHAASGDVPVFEITAIRYNESLDPAVFTLNVPDTVNWAVPPDQMSATRALPQSPKEAAAMFFDGLSRQDWDTLLTVFSSNAPPQWATHYAGLQVMSLGEPFQVPIYPGWFVPYQFTLNGHTKKWQLAVRNDNPAHRWVFDGGF
jgi:hypothetical protein